MTTAEIDREIPLREARFPGRPHIATVWRWASKGVTRGDAIVRLRTTVCGGRRYTTQRWADEFVAACNSATGIPAPVVMTPNRRARQATAAMDALKAMGVGG